jgi:thiol:disulfide interchange protein
MLALGLLLAAAGAADEIHVIDGVKYICTDDGMCMPMDEPPSGGGGDAAPGRLAQGYMDADEFVAFLGGEDVADAAGGALAGKGMWLVLVLVLLGGLAMNLTPCVLPMVPINLMVIGKSAARGAWYGAGMAAAYGALGVLASVGGMAFGEIQGSAWFNGAVAVVFLVLALALFDVFFIDLSKFRSAGGAAERRAKAPLAFAFSMGALSAVLAGACVAPILISVLLLTADLFAKGNWAALGLPFVMGVGMALPWPFVGAGMQVLPKPGAWMKKVNKAFGAVVLCFAAWYAYLAFAGATAEPSAGAVDATPKTFEKALEGAKRPVLVDCWASWCKNCAAMERGTLRDPKVVEALEGYTVIRLQAEDIRELKALKGFEGVLGLPAFLVVK